MASTSRVHSAQSYPPPLARERTGAQAVIAPTHPTESHASGATAISGPLCKPLAMINPLTSAQRPGPERRSASEVGETGVALGPLALRKSGLVGRELSEVDKVVLDDAGLDGLGDALRARGRLSAEVMHSGPSMLVRFPSTGTAIQCVRRHPGFLECRVFLRMRESAPRTDRKLLCEYLSRVSWLKCRVDDDGDCEFTQQFPIAPSVHLPSFECVLERFDAELQLVVQQHDPERMLVARGE